MTKMTQSGEPCPSIPLYVVCVVWYRLYTPYGCETAAHACTFVVEATVSMLISGV